MFCQEQQKPFSHFHKQVNQYFNIISFIKLSCCLKHPLQVLSHQVGTLHCNKKVQKILHAPGVCVQWQCYWHINAKAKSVYNKACMINGLLLIRAFLLSHFGCCSARQISLIFAENVSTFLHSSTVYEAPKSQRGGVILVHK